MGDSRMGALGGLVFALLFVAAFALVVGETPDYGAPDAEWTRWAEDSDANNRIALLAILLAGVAFLLFAGALRRALDDGPLTMTALAGGAVGVAGLVVAVVLLRAGSVHGAGSDATVTRSVVEAAAAGFLLASLGFCAHLLAVGLHTLRTGAFARWSGIVALVGAAAFLATFLTGVDSGDESPFGVGFPIGFLCLAIWTAAASLRLSVVAAPSPAPPLPSTR
jgi:hypothetical protein